MVSVWGPTTGSSGRSSRYALVPPLNPGVGLDILMNRVLAAFVLAAPLAVSSSEPPPPLEIHRVPPQYPRTALRDKVEGFVDFEATVGEDGAVLDVTVLASSPPGTFDSAAQESVMKWQFMPKCSTRFEHPFKIRSRVEFQIAEDPNKADPTLYAVEQHVSVSPPDRKIVQAPSGFVIQAVDPCAKQ